MAKIPKAVQYIRDLFEESDIENVWQHLGKVYGFNVRAWKNEFEAEINPLPRESSITETFILFGKKKIEPLLNEILRRKQHPTWIEMLTEVLKQKIENRAARDALYKNRYH